MGMNFSENDFASVIIENSLNEKAASSKLLQGRKRCQKQVTPNKWMCLLCIMVSIIYLGSMLIYTILIQQDYEKTFDANLDAIQEFVRAKASGDIDECVNSITTLKLANDERQMFSVAVYDNDGKLLAMTKPSLHLVSDDGESYYFSLDEYFNDSQIEELLAYVRNTSDPYLIEAKIGKKSGKLYSLNFSGEQKTIVWKWENKNTTDSKENLNVITKKIEVKQIFSAFCYEEDSSYKKWVNNEFLNGFESVLSEDIRENKESYEKFTLSKSNAETFEKMTYMNESGEEESCVIAIRSVGNTLGQAMKLLLPAYVIGFIVTSSVIIMVYNIKRKMVLG